MKTENKRHTFFGREVLEQSVLLIIFLLFATSLFAQQSGEIKGKVFDKSSKETIPGANVWVEAGGKKIGASTDMDGKFTIKPLQPGTYNLYVSFMGFNTQLITSVAVSPDKITFVKEVQLEPSSKTLGPVIVQATHEDQLINPETPGKMTIKGADIMRAADNRNLVTMVASITTDVKVSDDGKSIHIRGGRSGSEAYYVDGVLCSSLENLVPSMAIRSIAVYAGGIPAQYGDITSGVVVIETKGYFDMLNEWQAKQLLEEHLREQEKRNRGRSRGYK